MPLYEYICTSCSLKLEIVRPIAQYDDLPNEKEIADAEGRRSAGEENCPPEKEHILEKRISKAPHSTYSSSWAGGGRGKGSW